jgi:Na+/serine symporter
MKKNNRLFGIFSYICQRNQNNYLMQLSTIFNKWSQTSLVLRIFVGLIIGACLGLIVPQWTGISILGIVFVSALKAIAPVLVAVLVAASIAKAGGGLSILATTLPCRL